jgi:hypothetical protein
MEENELDEILFVESNVPYGAMKAELSRLTYYDGNNFYFMLGDKVNCVNVPEKKLSYLVDGVSMSDVSVSDNMEVMAYPSAEAQEDTDSITLVNFKTGNTYTLQAGAGECLKCFDFTGTNLIYGVSDSADSTYSVENDSIIPAKKIYFINESGEEIKEYDKSGYYITDVTVEEDMIYLDRVTAEGQGFVAGDSDFITYKEDQENPGIKESSKAISTGVEKKYLVFPSNIYISYVPKIIITKDKVKDTPVNMVVEVDNESANYMVYDNLGLSGIYETAGDAILYAIQVSGIVISKNGEVVYRKADSLEYNTIASAIFHYSSNSVEKSLQDCLYMTLVYQGGTLDYSDLDSYTDAVTALNELGSYEGVDISGVDLDMVFSYVSNEVPVISRIDDGRYVLIVSYNSESIRYYDPVIGDEVKTTRALYDKSMDLWSRELYSYIK